MQVLGIVGPDAAAAALAERVRAAIGADGSVALVEATDERPDGNAPAEVHRLADEGWSARGGERSLEDVLDDLAPRVEYAIVRGFPAADVPTVALGDATAEREPLQRAADADAVDLDALQTALEAAEPYETLESLVADVKRSADATYSGAIATFTGRVREREDADDEPTEYLEFEKYDGVAETRMGEIRADLEARDGILDVRLHHKTGVVEAGEDIVHVVVLAGHRTEAFDAVEDGIDRLKDEVPLFKKEVMASEEFWAHEGRPD